MRSMNNMFLTNSCSGSDSEANWVRRESGHEHATVPVIDGDTNPLHLEQSWPSYVVAVCVIVSFLAILLVRTRTPKAN